MFLYTDILYFLSPLFIIFFWLWLPWILLAFAFVFIVINLPFFFLLITCLLFFLAIKDESLNYKILTGVIYSIFIIVLLCIVGFAYHNNLWIKTSIKWDIKYSLLEYFHHDNYSWIFHSIEFLILCIFPIYLWMKDNELKRRKIVDGNELQIKKGQNYLKLALIMTGIIAISQISSMTTGGITIISTWFIVFELMILPILCENNSKKMIHAIIVINLLKLLPLVFAAFFSCSEYRKICWFRFNLLSGSSITVLPILCFVIFPFVYKIPELRKLNIFLTNVMMNFFLLCGLIGLIKYYNRGIMFNFIYCIAMILVTILANVIMFSWIKNYDKTKITIHDNDNDDNNEDIWHRVKGKL